MNSDTSSCEAAHGVTRAALDKHEQRRTNKQVPNPHQHAQNLRQSTRSGKPPPARLHRVTSTHLRQPQDSIVGTAVQDQRLRPESVAAQANSRV